MSGGSESTHRTVPVKEDTKERFLETKREGLTQDAFVNDLLDLWENENDDS